MTVIATDGRTMAGDTQTTGSSQILRYHQKVRRLNDGRIVGACGLTTECVRLVRWLNDGGDKPELSDDVCAIILNKDGSVDWVDNKLEILPGNLVPYAIGSGGDMALGAMLAGKSPAEAAKIACERQVDCGGQITVLSHEPETELRAVA